MKWEYRQRYDVCWLYTETVLKCAYILVLLLSLSQAASEQIPPSKVRQLDSLMVYWSRRTGLPLEDVSRILRAAGLSALDEQGVDLLDPATLQDRKEILLVTSEGNGHCLTLHILKRQKGAYKEVWMTSELPIGAGLCRMSPLNSIAQAVRPNEIVVRIPVFDYVKCAATEDRVYVYRGDKSGYRLVREYRTSPLRNSNYTCTPP